MSVSYFEIETERLRIRPWRKGDRDAFRGLVREPEVVRYLGQGEPWSEEDIDAFMDRQRDQVNRLGFSLGALVCRRDKQVVGLAGLQPLGKTNDLEIGWWLAPDRWGQGFATEAGRASAEFAFDHIGVERVVAITRPENKRSQAVMERIGMVFDRETDGHALGLLVPDVRVVLYRLERGNLAD